MGGFAQKLLFAVCTKSGVLVDQHFGHASEFSIYECVEGGIQKTDVRPVRQYCAGADECSAEERMRGILDAIAGCAGVICLRIGPDPVEILQQKGFYVFTACDRIEDAVEAAAMHCKAG